MLRKTLVLDTSAIINQPNIFTLLENTSFVIPLEVLEELDNAKVKNDATGFNSRRAIRVIDEIRDGDDLIAGVEFGKGNILTVSTESNLALIPPVFAPSTDTKIISVAKKHSNEDFSTTLVSADIAMRIKANAIGVESASDDEILFGREDIVYSGCKVIDISSESMSEFYQLGFIICISAGLYQNQSVILKSYDGSSALGRVVGGKIVKLRGEQNILGVCAKNKEQRFALEYLLDKDVSMVSVAGLAGSGKTILAIISAMYMLEKNMYEKIVLCRPAVSMSTNIGALPGPQPLDAKILTPTGWTTMGQLEVGSKVITRNGTAANVIGIFPKGNKSVYKISTNDGCSTEACDDHLWQTETYEERKRWKGSSIKTTKEISLTLSANNGMLNHYLPRNKSVHFDSKELPIKPYLLGAMLGDGSISDHITFYNTDEDIISRVRFEAGTLGCKLTFDGGIGYTISGNHGYNKTARPVQITDIKTGLIQKYQSIGSALADNQTIKRSTLHSRCSNSRIVGDKKYEFLPLENRWQNILKEELYKLGLQSMHAWNKFIPAKYKYESSVNDRIELLRGLMDTDGTIKKNGEASFCTISKQLALDVIEVVKSLGGRSVLRSRDRTGNEVSKPTLSSGRIIKANYMSYEFNISLPTDINPFFTARKASRHKCHHIVDSKIKSIEYIGEKEVQCILIDHPEHLYITDDFIVTHNTKEEKLQPWAQPIFDNLKHAMKCSDTYLNLLMEKGKIEMESLSFIRGRTFPNTILIVDEAQNTTTSEMKAIITRMGENSKLIITGDLDQIDSPKLDIYSSGLSVVANKFKNSELAAHITLQKTERSDLAALAAKLL